jgi:hypothetical protein
MKKTLIAFAALASIAAGLAATASTAEAKVHVNLNIGLGGFGPGYYESGYGYYDAPDCGWEYGPVVKWRHGHQVVVYKNRWVCY